MIIKTFLERIVRKNEVNEDVPEETITATAEPSDVELQKTEPQTEITETAPEPAEERIYQTIPSKHFQDDIKFMDSTGKHTFRRIILAERSMFDSYAETISDDEYMNNIMKGKEYKNIIGGKKILPYNRPSNDFCMKRFIEFLESPKTEEYIPEIEEHIPESETDNVENIHVKGLESRTFSPHEDSIRKSDLYTFLKKFHIDEEAYLDKDTRFPTNVVKQCIGGKCDLLRMGDIIEELKIWYKVKGNDICGIIIPEENYAWIIRMTEIDSTKYGDIMGFIDDFDEKENIKLRYDGINSFSVVSTQKNAFLKKIKIHAKLTANNDFYIKIENAIIL